MWARISLCIVNLNCVLFWAKNPQKFLIQNDELAAIGSRASWQFMHSAQQQDSNFNWDQRKRATGCVQFWLRGEILSLYSK